MLRSLRSLSLVLAVASMLAPAVANAASKSKAAKSKTVYPTVSSISPRKLAVGQKLTIKGRYLRAGKGKSSVAFDRTGKSVVFVKADSATTKKIVVTLPSKLQGLLATESGKSVPTMLRLRVIGNRMGQAWTKNSRSPLVSAPAPPASLVTATPSGDAKPTAAQTYLTCQQQAAAAPTGDADADGVANAGEIHYGTDPCIADTDGDGLIDGYEFWSAVDLNGAATPSPGTRPWPNPLDPS